ncbi:hypothetical protein BAUCODRAFT_31622 [Baudoinia panamericana UAMH 10762]|uniref:Secreted protein n=1 Tax=Baudoinia panamericana (strain UAMH 10762) TaxID=717646 RepID=M2NJI5_BAUPA|nr:uncharacterized protein BAUCODRAFT_31622 [Baudoinia panamericana UAMH 10762]EMC99305.1 hypothetical protein BAUCODRAFT_31622 [Baudoinia panamericana UAMH 10762]
MTEPLAMIALLCWIHVLVLRICYSSLCGETYSQSFWAVGRHCSHVLWAVSNSAMSRAFRSIVSFLPGSLQL